MSSKREEERNEKIIRGLMKLPPNRRCINCNSMGPQYVCTNFWTFICMTCSGIHREFTHRVKSVSMAKFTSQEVDALQKGGNQRARELFMKSWDPQRQRLPDNSIIDKLREFIKNVYVDKKYVMDKTSDKPPKDPQSLRNDEDDTRRASSYHSYSQSPPYDFQYEERRYGKHAPVLSRKPGSDRGMYDGKLASFLSPSRFSDHVTDDSSQGDIGSPVSDTSKDFSGKVPQDRDGAMRTASYGSFGSFDSGSMSFKSINSLGMADGGSEPRKSTGISLEKSSSLPALPQSPAAGSFGGLDLFDSSFAPQNVASTAPNQSGSQFPESSLAQSIDLFQQEHYSSVSIFTEPQQSQIPQSAEKTSDVVTPINGGWATFDLARNVVPRGTENSVPVVETYNPFSLDQKASYQDFGGHSSFANTQRFEPLTNNNQVWNAFEEPDLHTVQSVLQNNEEPPVPNIFSDGDKFLGGVDEDLNENVRAPVDSENLLPILSSHSSAALSHIPVVPPLPGARLLADDHRPTNPFDLLDDDATNLEPGNLSQFWEMSSLQSALPNGEDPTSFIGGFDQSWFAQNSAPLPFDAPNGSLDFIAGQAPNPHIQNMNVIHPQGHIAASVGGNPFA